MTLAPRSVLAVALSLAAAAATFSFSSGASAADGCKTDAECGAGFFCEIAPPPSVACASPDGQPADCPEPTPAADPSGYCREKPISCSTDADCPSYLGCMSTGGSDTVCSAPPCAEGQECPEPVCETPKEDPNAPKICAPKMIECTSDAACPEGFACNIELGTACPAIACDPSDPNCKQPDCTPETKKLCGPKEIDCKADADCPTDWRCISFEEGSCSGGGSTGTGSGTATPGGTGVGTEPAPAPSPGSKTLDTSDCTTTVRNLCAPKGYIAGVEQGGVNLSGATGSAVAEAADDSSKNSTQAPSYSSPTRGSNTESNGASGSSDSDSGCSTSPRGQGAGLLSVLLVGLAARLARRRSR